MTLRQKLFIAMGTLSLLIASISALSVVSLTQIHDRVNHMVIDMNALEILKDIDGNVYRATVAERSVIFLKPGSADFESSVSSHKTALEKIETLSSSFTSEVDNQKLNTKFKKLLAPLSDWQAISSQVIAERVADTREGRRTAIDLSFGSGTEAFEKLNLSINEMIKTTKQAFNEETTSTFSTMDQSKLITIIAFVVSLVICGGIAWLMPRMVIRPIKEMNAVLDELATAGGDLRTEIRIRNNDEISQLGRTVNKFIAALRELISDIIVKTDQVSEQAALLDTSAKSNQGVALNTMSETESMATAITQMSASISEVAQSANSTSESAIQARNESNSGQQVVLDTQSIINTLASEVGGAGEKIERLKSDTDKIHDVVSVIQGIAEQTNLLALNAAIEAARAGEQGRGFAVVADEVRALASRTQSSTEEIQQMVGTLQQSADSAHSTMSNGKNVAEQSVEKASQAKDAFEKISSAIDLVSQMSIQIASAAEEQSSVSNEISENANRLSAYGQEAHGISDEVESLSMNTLQASEDLKAKLSIFKV
jgi:methyl-accepting chemotaxis protein